MTATEWTTAPTDLLAVERYSGSGVVPGVDLAAIDPHGTPGFDGDKKAGKQLLADVSDELSALQEKLFAASRGGGDTRSVLLVLQGMDTSGKGGIVRHVVGAVDPQGVAHYAFKAPTPEELEHDFLWRVRRALPGAGLIGVFDRSHYEDVLITRVHGTDADTIEERYAQIRAFEEELHAAGTTVIKVMLHISRTEQKERLAERLDRPDKYWKYNPGDVDERLLWPAYQEAYGLALANTSTEDAPWFVVPADRKWYARLAVQGLLLHTLRSLDLSWPDADFDVAEEKARLAAS
ncbi:polyphosphate kinase 2 family protein [Planctomonas psychrotolerans]|uniref:polyphosphate kinase 2 family protein n=1 Tax=Planctomonas psychrotolerans TaxID=2528712 RepID=UPI00123A0237|nr:polyphosphate kinase 2 family protein [Planctomonas psychrotolerans]